MKRRAFAYAWSQRHDALVFAGIALIGLGAGQFHPGLAAIAWGVGLILAVRFGS